MDIDPRLREANPAPSYPEPPSQSGAGSSSSAYGAEHQQQPSQADTAASAQGPPPPPAASHQQQHQYYQATPSQTSYYPPDSAALSQLSAYAQSALPESQSPTQGQHSHSQHQYGIQSQDPNDLKRPRACEACRQLKVRCEPGSNPTGDGPCKRCEKADRACIVTAPTRKRQKKADNRVAELERKIDALTASLQAKNASALAQGATGLQDEMVDPALAQVQAEMARLREQGSEQSHNPPGWEGWDQSTPSQLHRIPTDDASTASPSTKLGGGVKRKASEYGMYNAESQTTSPASYSQTFTPTLTHGPSPMTPGMEPPRPVPFNKKGQYVDVVERGVLDMDTATRIFEHYVAYLADKFPVVVFPPGTTAAEVRNKKPFLFVTILSVACATIKASIRQVLLDEVQQIYAEQIIIRGLKSLELVQSLLITCIWYPPPEKFEQMKFWQFNHMAAAMGMDIGLGKRVKPGALYGFLKDGAQSQQSVMSDPQAVETRRAWAGCYLMCSGAALVLRRPSFLRWVSYMDESIEVLRNSPHALPTDKTLILFLELQRIAEEVAFRFCMDDPASQVSLADAQIQYALKGFERQLEDWHTRATKESMTPSLKHTYHNMTVFVHEIAMHTDHNIDDFKPPWNNLIAQSEVSQMTSPAHVDSLIACIRNCHAILDVMLSFSIPDVQALPTLMFGRTIYSVVVLIKIHAAVTAEDSKIGAIINKDDLRIDEYLHKFFTHLKTAAEGDKSRAAKKFAFLVCMLGSWYTKRSAPQNGAHCGLASGEEAGESRSAEESTTQTPLHLLSEVAMGNNSNNNNVAATKHTPTSVDSPTVTTPNLPMNPTTISQPEDTKFPAWPNPYAPNTNSQLPFPQQPLTPNTVAQNNLAISDDINSFFQGTDLMNIPFALDDLTELGMLMDDSVPSPWGFWSGGTGGNVVGNAGGF